MRFATQVSQDGDGFWKIDKTIWDNWPGGSRNQQFYRINTPAWFNSVKDNENPSDAKKVDRKAAKQAGNWMIDIIDGRLSRHILFSEDLNYIYIPNEESLWGSPKRLAWFIHQGNRAKSDVNDKQNVNPPGGWDAGSVPSFP